MTQSVEQHSDLMKELDEALAELGFTAEYQAQLIEILQRGWLRGPRTIPFDSNYESWQLKRCHLHLCTIYQSEDRLRRAPKAAAIAPKALHSVRKLIEALPPADADLLRDTVERLRVVTDQQSAIARTQPPRKRGGQTDSSQIPELALILLFDYYFKVTGDWPTKYEDGPFVAFAAAILEVPTATVLRHLKELLNALHAYSADCSESAHEL